MAERKNRFKTGVDSNDARRRREESSIRIRKNKREEGLAKRRQINNFVKEEEIAGADGTITTSGSRKYNTEDIPALRAGVQSTDPKMVLESVRGFRKILSIEPSPPVQEVLESGVMPLLVNFLGASDYNELQFEAAWALTNIASTDQTRKVVEANAVPGLVALLLSPNADVREQCAWCLGNIAGDCPELRNFVLGSGALSPILQNIIHPESTSMLRNTVWALSNLCRGKPQPALEQVAEAMPILAQTVCHEDKEVVMDSCWALSYLSDGEDARVEAVVQTGITQRLVQLLGHGSATVITPALRTVGNIVSGSDSQTQAVIDAGGLSAVLPLLSHSKKGIRKEACWMLSNIAAGSRDQISAVLQTPGIVNGVVLHLSGEEWDVRKEAAWVISNIATGGSHDQICALLRSESVVSSLCSLLTVSDAKILMVALDAIEALLKCNEKTGNMFNVTVKVDECDGLQKLEDLQEHDNDDIYNKAVSIIETYFGAEEDDGGENLAPNATAQQFSFGVTEKALVPSGGFNFSGNNFQFNAAH